MDIKASKKKLIFVLLMIVALFILFAIMVQAEGEKEQQINSDQAIAFSVPSGSQRTASPSPAASTPSPTPEAGEKTEVTLDNYDIDYQQFDDPLLVLVGPKVKIPDDFNASPTDYDGVMVSSFIYSAIDKLLKDGRAAGAELWLASGYRDQGEQGRLLDEGIQNRMDDYGMTYDEARENALNSFTEPGYSEHHTGLSVDFNDVSHDFCESDSYEWLNENCWKYGFIQRYPPEKTDITGIIYEPWHYRYVGKAHAEAMHQMNLCFEEYIVYLKNQER